MLTNFNNNIFCIMTNKIYIYSLCIFNRKKPKNKPKIIKIKLITAADKISLSIFNSLK